MSRKECRKYYFSVEGETEKWYLKWLQELINNIDQARYKVQFDVKVTKNPKKRVKEMTILGNTEILHMFDFEELPKEDEFKNTLTNMKEASKLKRKVKYALGYCNYTFDLWIILHKECLMQSKNHRSNYLHDINRCFGQSFDSMLEYKEEANFKRILSTLNLDNVLYAIRNAEKISMSNEKTHQKMQHSGYTYYRENPSLNLHEYIKEILQTVGLI